MDDRELSKDFVGCLKTEWWKTTNRRFEVWNHNDSEEGEQNDD